MTGIAGAKKIANQTGNVKPKSQPNAPHRSKATHGVKNSHGPAGPAGNAGEQRKTNPAGGPTYKSVNNFGTFTIRSFGGALPGFPGTPYAITIKPYGGGIDLNVLPQGMFAFSIPSKSDPKKSYLVSVDPDGSIRITNPAGVEVRIDPSQKVADGKDHEEPIETGGAKLVYSYKGKDKAGKPIVEVKVLDANGKQVAVIANGGVQLKTDKGWVDVKGQLLEIARLLNGTLDKGGKPYLQVAPEEALRRVDVLADAISRFYNEQIGSGIPYYLLRQDPTISMLRPVPDKQFDINDNFMNMLRQKNAESQKAMPQGLSSVGQYKTKAPVMIFVKPDANQLQPAGVTIPEGSPITIYEVKQVGGSWWGRVQYQEGNQLKDGWVPLQLLKKT